MGKIVEKRYVSKWCGNILHIYDFTYRQNYYYIPARSHKEYQSICLKELKCKIEDKTETKSGGFNVLVHKTKTDVCYIWAVDKKDIVHECFHAISYVLRNRGIPLNDDTEEAFAYAIGFLTEQIFEGIKLRCLARRGKGEGLRE